MVCKESIYKIIPKEVLSEIFNDFELDIDEGEHGFSHWARVIHNGLEISQENEANPNVIIAFGMFHDIKRENEYEDPEHGFRGGELLMSYKGRVNLTLQELETARIACSGHTSELYSRDLDVGTCWDADRLDLYRVGKLPDVKYLNNDYSKRKEVIDEASDRAEEGYIPDWALDIYDELIVPIIERKNK